MKRYLRQHRQRRRCLEKWRGNGTILIVINHNTNTISGTAPFAFCTDGESTRVKLIMLEESTGNGCNIDLTTPLVCSSTITQ